MAKVLAISSHVTRGHVGLSATVPALQHLGHEVWAVPTVLLASRPGLGRLVRHELPPTELAAALAALEADGCWTSLGAVLTGYFPSPRAVTAAADAVRKIRTAAPAIPILVDPILGDEGRLYVAEATAAAIRDQLLPLSTIATPNLFELTWLTGASCRDREGAVVAARGLGLQAVVVTSAAQTENKVSTLLITGLDVVEHRSPRHDGIANGAGDLFAGLFLGHWLNGRGPEAALQASLADTDRVLADSVACDVLDLSALNRGRPYRAV
jgi:pyridoxine kinase